MRTAEDSDADPVISDEADLLTATGWDSWVDLIEEEVEPHYVEASSSEDTGIHFIIRAEGVGLAQGVYLDYPFTLSEFWSEVHEADVWATKEFFDMVRDEQFTEFAASAREADGVVAVEMKDLYNAAGDAYWQLRPEKITKKQLSFIRKTLRTYGLAAAWLPAAPKAWALLYLRKSPIAREIRVHLVTSAARRPTRPSGGVIQGETSNSNVR